MQTLLQVKNLSVKFFTEDQTIDAVNGISFSVAGKEALALVGETGSGKSVTALSIMRLIDEPGKIVNGKILFNDKNLLNLSENDLQKIRGKDIAMIFQDPALNPVMRIVDQISEPLIAHKGLSKSSAKLRSIELLSEVGMSAPEKVANFYPHELSGGMKQRAMIAMAISCQPKLLIADEPTTALDVTIQAQILQLLAALRRKYRMSLLFITHDLATASQLCENVVVLKRGKIVETGKISNVFKSPKEDYTKNLLKSASALSLR